MASQPRIYLFHGNDSRASSTALRRWEELFRSKYGETTKYVLNADELTPEQLIRSLSELLQGNSLFPEPKLILIKRATSSEKGASIPFSKALAGFFATILPQLSSLVTLVVWEEKQLSETNPLYKWFSTHTDQSQAGITLYTVPHWREVGKVAKTHLSAAGYNWTLEADHWLVNRYQQQEKIARLAQRLKSTESLAVDERSWWLYQLLDNALLHAQNNVVEASDLEASAAELVEGVSVFEIVNALSDSQWMQARKLLQLWEDSKVDESSYFGLYALLRMQYKRRGNQYALQLLAELDVIFKNFTLPHAWLIELFILRLENARSGEKESLLPPRKLWLAQVHRS